MKFTFLRIVGVALIPSAILNAQPASKHLPQSSASAQSNMTLEYPETKTVDVVDNYHGRQVADPYRWLEDVESDETAAWVQAQNQLTQSYLSELPSRSKFRDSLERLWNYERFGLPHPVANNSESDAAKPQQYFFSHNDGLQDQSILYVAQGPDSPRRVLIDPNQLSDDGTVALSSWVPSKDGRLVAYTLADGGSDWRTVKVRTVATGEDTDDLVRWVKFSGIAWLSDASGFFYARYDEPGDGEELTGTNENQKLFFHRLGTDQADDLLVYARPDHPQWGFSPEVTDDGRFLVVQNWKGTEPKTQIFIRRLNGDDPLRGEGDELELLIGGFEADFEFVASVDDTLYFLTDDQAPRRRLIAVDANDPQREQWREVIAQHPRDVLQGVQLFGETFYADYLQDARSRVARYTIDGTAMDDLELPGVGSVGGLSGQQDATETFFSFTNYVTPSSIYRLDLTNGQTELWRSPNVDFAVQDYLTEQVFVTSRDGTRVPMIITRHRNSQLDGENQTLLYGYGGFNISLTPSYSPAIAAWLDAGGIYAVANLRGGGEYGRQWHEDGMRLKKQNVFDDFIASAEYLIDQGYTRSSKLGIRGGSNGGLLVGAVMTQRPDLFAACLPAVGVMDMLRYHKFTIGWAWATEYGSSDEEDQIDNLLSYSPLHNLKPGVCYPATLITTADRDDRVVPGHSFKFAAALQAAQGCEHPTLIRIETRAGHGAGTPVSKRIEEYADLWSFLDAATGGNER
ncbi:prolyl oligopeptidase family serine peptidase [Crateriforma conspicua]|uniref:prolyl oligopeptidase n=1 Tax=Crateriforma conspicua TaxID=2527996 RepID=A0A5C6FKE8_9PLAN|nr:prolyl oligopeptidase family serine peptidase [Crateriforma conspicua]TWU61078.1 Prolyl endopeptidase [Crateriforma conspicua]